MRHIAVIDIGKTNAKLALVDRATLAEIAVVTRPNRVLPGPPYPHFDLDGHWAFLLEHLAAVHAAHGVDAISVTTHGAAGVLLAADGGLATPMLDYEHDGPDCTAAAYEALRPDFALTGSPRLGLGLNLGAQVHWLLETQPGLRERTAHVMTYPQYWGYRLTGQLASDVTSLGCHTDLWLPREGTFSPLVAALGLSERMAPVRRPDEILGTIQPGIARLTGLSPATPVACGIHDSNASLYPYVLWRKPPFSVLSTGTWVVTMAVGGGAGLLDSTRDVLVNVNGLGQPVPSARFMGGREFAVLSGGVDTVPTDADRRGILDRRVMILPAAEPGSGPFRGRKMEWTAAPEGEGERAVAIAHYLALMADTCLTLIDARGPVIVEGPFARNPDFVAMLAAIRPEGVEIAASVTGTSTGAALLFPCAAPAPVTRAVGPPFDATALRLHADDWRARSR